MTPTGTGPQAVIDKLLDEGAETFPALAKRLPRSRGGAAVSPSCMSRWAAAGVRLPNGERVRLESFRLGGKRLSSWPAVLRFLAAQQVTAPAAPAVRSPAERQQASESAGKQLELMGV